MNNYIKFLSKYISGKRFRHSISTANFMKQYAKYFNIKKEIAYLAGLLHDIAKELSNKKIISLSNNFKKRNIVKINYFEFKKNYPALLHGVASAEILFTKMNIDDYQILEAACYHTQGGPNISDLSKFTFISDYCEPFRNYVHAIKIRNIITNERKLNKAYYFTYTYLIQGLIKRKKIICPESIDGYNYSLKIYNK